LATKRGEVLLIMREGEALDKYLVELEALNHLEGVEVPDNDVSLRKFRIKFQVLKQSHQSA
jgi:hypothetical protein